MHRSYKGFIDAPYAIFVSQHTEMKQISQNVICMLVPYFGYIVIAICLKPVLLTVVMNIWVCLVAHDEFPRDEAFSSSVYCQTYVHSRVDNQGK